MRRCDVGAIGIPRILGIIGSSVHGTRTGDGELAVAIEVPCEGAPRSVGYRIGLNHHIGSQCTSVGAFTRKDDAAVLAQILTATVIKALQHAKAIVRAVGQQGGAVIYFNAPVIVVP